MEARRVASALAAARVAVGVAAFAAPGLAGRAWVGGDGERPGTQLAMRALGIRDLVLGLGTLVSLSEGRDPEHWLEAGAVADAGDLTAAVLGRDELPTFRVLATAASAGAATAAGVWARMNLRDRDQPPLP